MAKRLAVYLRVSKKDGSQTVDSQRAACKAWLKANRYRSSDYFWVTDEESGAKAESRKGLQSIMRRAEKGQIRDLLVYSLDRLSRSTLQGLELLSYFADRNVSVHSIRENVDFQGSIGQMLSGIFLSIAQYERSLLRQRVSDGVRAKQRRDGKNSIGRPINHKRRAQVRALYENGTGVTEIARRLKITRQAVYKSLHATRDDRMKAAS